MENLVKINNELYINLEEAVKIEVKNGTIVVYLRETDGSLVGHYCHSSEPGYNKLKRILEESISK